MQTTRPMVLVLALSISCPTARAQVATKLCVEIRAGDADRENLRKLVVNELGHHPTHSVMEKDCQSLLAVELFEIKGIYYLTARINQEVPVRYDFTDFKELAEKVSSAVSSMLSHDPVYLSDDITHYSAIQRAAHSILKRGHNVWRLELFQGIGRGGNSVVFSPGGAVSISRGADNWRVFARIYFSGWPGEVDHTDRALRINTGADVGLTYEFSALSNTTFYASAGVGLQYLRYEGRLVPDDPNSTDQRNDFGPTFHLRVGLRFLRIFDFDCDLFVAGYLPLFPADVDTQLEDFYPPTLQAGLGVGF